MSDQGERDERRGGENGDWWNQLYDPAAPDTGGSPADDTIDDRFASARAVGVPPSGQPVVRAEDRPGPNMPEGEAGIVESPPPSAASPAAPAPAGTAGADPERAAWLDRLFGTEESEDGHRPSVESRHPPHAVPGSDAYDAGSSPERRPGGTRRRSVRDVLGHAARHDGASGVLVPPRGGLAPPEPGALAEAAPDALLDPVPDTVLDGARHDALVLRAVSARGGSARQRGEPRGDALFTVRFGTGTSALLFAALAVGTGTAPAGRRAARELCQSIGEAVGRSRPRLVEDIANERRATLAGGLKRLTDRCYGRLRAQEAALGLAPGEYSADLRCLLAPTDPACMTRVVFGAGGGGLFRLRDGSWADLGPRGEKDPGERRRAAVPARRPDPREPDPREPEGVVGEDGAPGPPAFRFCAVTAEPGDALLLCGTGLAVPLRGDPAFADQLAVAWSGRAEPPDLATFLTDVQYPAPAYGDDRTAVALWHGSR